MMFLIEGETHCFWYRYDFTFKYTSQYNQLAYSIQFTRKFIHILEALLTSNFSTPNEHHMYNFFNLGHCNLTEVKVGLVYKIWNCLMILYTLFAIDIVKNFMAKNG